MTRRGLFRRLPAASVAVVPAAGIVTATRQTPRIMNGGPIADLAREYLGDTQIQGGEVFTNERLENFINSAWQAEPDAHPRRLAAIAAMHAADAHGFHSLASGLRQSLFTRLI